MAEQCRHVTFCEDVDCIEYFVDSDMTDTEDEPEAFPIQPESYPSIIENTCDFIEETSTDERKTPKTVLISVRRPPIRPQAATASQAERQHHTLDHRSKAVSGSRRGPRTPAGVGTKPSSRVSGLSASVVRRPLAPILPSKYPAIGKSKITPPILAVKPPVRKFTASRNVVVVTPPVTVVAPPPREPIPAQFPHTAFLEVMSQAVPSQICEDIRCIALSVRSQNAPSLASFAEFKKRQRLAVAQLAYAQWKLKHSSDNDPPPTLCFEIAALRTLIPKLAMKVRCLRNFPLRVKPFVGCYCCEC